MLLGQVETEIPEPEASAKPVVAERIKIHGPTLEGNLEGDAVDRDVLVYLPTELSQKEETALYRRLCLVRLFHWGGPVEQRDPRSPTDRGHLRKRREGDDRRTAWTQRPSTTDRCTKIR